MPTFIVPFFVLMLGMLTIKVGVPDVPGEDDLVVEPAALVEWDANVEVDDLVIDLEVLDVVYDSSPPVEGWVLYIDDSDLHGIEVAESIAEV